MTHSNSCFSIISWLICLLFSLPALGQVDSTNNSKKTNILFIAVDDLKPMIGAYGNKQIHTPEMDKLADQGVTFFNNHTQYAVCGPSRASLLTGWRPDSTKVWRLNVMIRDKHPDVVTLPQYFKENGYTTAGIGKIFDRRSVDNEHDERSWSLSYSENMPRNYPKVTGAPFVHYQSPEVKKKSQQYVTEAEEMGMTGWERKEYALEHVKPSTEILDIPDEAYIDGLLAMKGQELMEQLSGNSAPFFLSVGFIKPHLPFTAPQKYWDLYEREEIKLSEWQKPSVDGPDIAYHEFGELRSYTDIPPAIDENGLVNETKQKELIHGYMAAVSYIDTQIGKLMNKLDELGLRENTIVVLWGDHGWHLGDHGLWCKHSNFEQATRSPLIISGPGMEKDLKIYSPTEFVDLYPTLTDLTSLDIPDHLQGKSLSPILRGEKQRVKDFAISQYRRGADKMGYAIRTDRYRYIEWHENGYRSFKPYSKKNLIAQELYDYKKDPKETVNLIGQEIYREQLEELKGKLKEFLTETSESKI